MNLINLFLLNKVFSPQKTYDPVMCWGLDSAQTHEVETKLGEIIQRYDPRWVPNYDDYWQVKYDTRHNQFTARRINWMLGSEFKVETLDELLVKIETYYRYR